MQAQMDSIIIRWHGTVARHAPPVTDYFVYLLHFKSRYYHAGHYCGMTANLDARLLLHRTGHGARLTRAVAVAGINFEIARLWKCETWEDARALERKLKSRHDGPGLCPLCQHKPVDFLVQLRQGHWPISRFAQPGRRQPTAACRPPSFVHR